MSGESKVPPIKRYVIQVNPGRPRLGIDLTLCKKDWLPDARNKRMKLTARIYAFKGGKWVYPGEKRKVTFKFKEGDDGKKKVSKEKGICLNFPKKDDSNENPDLFFAEDGDNKDNFKLEEDDTSGDPCPKKIIIDDDNPEHEHHYLKATTKKAVTEAIIEVRCEDYGAFGTIQAEAEDCETLKPRESNAGCSQEIGDNDVKIPRDDNDNDIADSAKSWDNVSLDKKKDNSTAPADEDEDESPSNTNKGDGLTNYEEYRGFIVKSGVNKIHKRTNINKKDIFIYDKDNLGTGYFNASGLIIHLIHGPDYYNGNSSHNNDSPPTPSDRQTINCNRTSHTGGDQHGLRLENEAMGGTDEGYTYGGNVPLLPKDVNYVAVDNAKHGTAALLSCTVAHELGHAAYAQHHGDSGDCGACNHDQAGSLTSGHALCIMRYSNYGDSHWCHKVGGACHNHAIPNPETPGNIFCTSANGTGCNVVAGHFTNNADRGDCKGQIKVKDW
jgi:hypothetical protein